MVDVDGELASDGQELFAVSYRGQVGALAADTGRTLWSREMSAYGGVAMSGDRLYVTDAASTVWSLDARSGTALWKNEALAFRWLSSPAVVGDYVAVADFEGYVHLINSDNGQFAARTRVGSDPVRAAPLVVGSTLYVAGSDGDLAAFRVGG
jgi:outer membrane protein assembly factor BamB